MFKFSINTRRAVLSGPIVNVMPAIPTEFSPSVSWVNVSRSQCVIGNVIFFWSLDDCESAFLFNDGDLAKKLVDIGAQVCRIFRCWRGRRRRLRVVGGLQSFCLKDLRECLLVNCEPVLGRFAMKGV